MIDPIKFCEEREIQKYNELKENVIYMNELINELKKLVEDDSGPIDRDRLYGETPDDTYDWGFEDGRVSLAKKILKVWEDYSSKQSQ